MHTTAAHRMSGAGSVTLTRLCTLEGEERPVGAIAAAHGIRPGTILDVPGKDASARLTEAGVRASKAADRWRERLIGGGDHPYRLPFDIVESPEVRKIISAYLRSVEETR
ncbi:hypothetical protein ACWD6R_33620 [Streptomyces sp. NPDC005151]